MVSQCRNLFENDSACGSLYITVDGSKFLLNFSYSLKVLLDVTISQELSCLSKYESNEIDSNHELTDSCKFTSDRDSDVHENSTQYKLLSDQGQRVVISKAKAPKKDERRDEKQNVISKVLSKDSDTEQIKGKDSLQIIQSDNSNTSDINITTAPNIGNDAHKAKKRKESNTYAVNEDSSFSKSVSSLAATRASNKNGCDFNQYSYDSDGADIIQEESRHSVSLGGADISVLPYNNLSKTRATSSSGNGQKISTCRDCYTNFETTRALKDHRKVKTSDIKCDECLEVFQYQAFLQIHKISNHGSSGAAFVQKDNQYWYKCNTCGSLAESLIKLQIHNLIHTGEGAFQCCLCPQQFWETKDLSEHVTQSHRLSWKVRCWTCNKWFENRAARSRHKINCSKFKCHLCNEVFTHKTIRNQHFTDVHPNDILKCKQCKHMFSSQVELDIHTENHSKRKKKQCPTCGLLFNDVRRHMLTHKSPNELSESDYIYCDKCPERYCNKSSYNRHQRLKHPPDNSYKCTNCPKAFGHHEPLRRHMRRCKPLLLNSCQICGKKFATLEQLKSHMTSHPNDKNIISHSNTGSSSNIFLRCPVCTQSFVYRDSFEAHMQMRHPHFASNSNRITHPITGSASETVKSIRESTSTTTYDNTPFVYSTNGLMEAVIQGITDLTNAPTPLKF